MFSPSSQMLPSVGLTSFGDGASNGGFSAPAFANQPERFARRDLKTDAIDGLDRSALRWKVDLQMSHFQKRLRGAHWFQ